MNPCVLFVSVLCWTLTFGTLTGLEGGAECVWSTATLQDRGNVDPENMAKWQMRQMFACFRCS